MVILGGIGNIWGAVLGAFALTYVDKTLLPYIGQRIGDVAPSLPNPAEYNFLIYGVILVLMMRFRPQGFLPSRQREAELTVHGLEEAEAAIGIEVEVDNIGVAPPGQSEVGPGARDVEVPGEGRDL
jgi:hypothetical protein